MLTGRKKFMEKVFVKVFFPKHSGQVDRSFDLTLEKLLIAFLKKTSQRLQKTDRIQFSKHAEIFFLKPILPLFFSIATCKWNKTWNILSTLSNYKQLFPHIGLKMQNFLQNLNKQTLFYCTLRFSSGPAVLYSFSCDSIWKRPKFGPNIKTCQIKDRLFPH